MPPTHLGLAVFVATKLHEIASESSAAYILSDFVAGSGLHNSNQSERLVLHHQTLPGGLQCEMRDAIRKSAFGAKRNFKVEERVNRDICMSCGMSGRSPSSCMNENMTRVPLYCSSGLDAEGCRWIHSHAKHVTYQDAGLAKVRLTFRPIKSCVLLTGMAYGMQFCLRRSALWSTIAGQPVSAPQFT